MRMQLIATTLSVLVIAHSAAIAQETNPSQQAQAPGASMPRARCGGSTDYYSAKQLLDKTLNRIPGSPSQPVLVVATARNPLKAKPAQAEEIPVSLFEGRALSRTLLSVTLNRPNEISAEEWASIYTYGVAETARKQSSGDPAEQVPIGAFVTERGPNDMKLAVLVPDNPKPLSIEVWRVVPVICGKNDDLLGYGIVTVTALSPGLAWAISLGALIMFWSFITLATYQLNKDKLDQLWLKRKGDLPSNDLRNDNPKSDRTPPTWGTVHARLWKFVEAANPVFISQSSLGYGSLSRFQILMFTTVVGLVLLYIFVHSGVLSEMSDTILWLLGITVAGGTLARAADDWSSISTRNRQLLIGQGILCVRRDKPRFFDLLETQGEIDVAKVQALAFTGLVAISLLVNGLMVGLGAFELPNQIIYLTGISQGAYVLGKVLPSDTRKRLDQDLEQLHIAADNLRAKPDDLEAMSAFEQAKRTAYSTLSETYLERFNQDKFNQLTLDKL